MNKDERKLGLSLKLEAHHGDHAAGSASRKPRKASAPSHKPAALEQPKAKSLLQIELEKMASRGAADKDGSDSE